MFCLSHFAPSQAISSQNSNVGNFQPDCHNSSKNLFKILTPGFVPSVKGTSSKSGLKEWHAEWQWEFVRMQQFLLKSLNHPQTRFFLFVILMYRTHLKETTSIDEAFLRFVPDFFSIYFC